MPITSDDLRDDSFRKGLASCQITTNQSKQLASALIQDIQDHSNLFKSIIATKEIPLPRPTDADVEESKEYQSLKKLHNINKQLLKRDLFESIAHLLVGISIILICLLCGYFILNFFLSCLMPDVGAGIGSLILTTLFLPFIALNMFLSALLGVLCCLLVVIPLMVGGVALGCFAVGSIRSLIDTQDQPKFLAEIVSIAGELGLTESNPKNTAIPAHTNFTANPSNAEFHTCVISQMEIGSRDSTSSSSSNNNSNSPKSSSLGL